jgi:peptidoglycan/LPS O-acetylase OafA/YrhL
MPALTGIRLPLALWVVTHHISGPGRMFQPVVGASAVVSGFVDAAWVALSVFFAISGFVLARRYQAQRWNAAALGRYAVARFARIYPVYLLSLVILLPIIAETLRRDDVSVTQGAGLLLNHLLLLQAWHWPAVDWNTPAWSLSAEVFFYALAPLAVQLVRTPSWPRVAAAASLACAVPLLARLLIEPPAPKALLYLGDFLIGIAAAGAFERLRATGWLRVGPWLYGVAAAAGVTLLLGRDLLGPFIVFDTGVRIVSALLVTGLACGGGWLVRILSSPLVLAGGQASYAIYILHIPVVWYYRRWGYDTIGHPVVAGVGYVLIVMALSLIVARWYEAPANVLVRRWLSGRRRREREPVTVSAGERVARRGERQPRYVGEPGPSTR